MVQLELLETLPERVANHAKLFDGMLQLIPAKYYISQKKPQNENSKYMVNKRKKAPKQEIKEATKKAKKAKLDPENVKSITQVQNEELEKTKQEQVVEDEDMSDGEEEAVGGDFSGLDSAKNDTAPVNTAKTDTTDNFQPMLRSDIAELHTRLQKRIAEMRRKRNAPNSDSPKARSREDMLQERRKRREEKKKALKAKKEKGNKAPSEALVDTKPQESTTKDNEKSSADSIKMDGDLFFGKINVGQEKKKKKGSTDAKTALKKLEEKQAELEKLRQEDEEMADAMVEESHWGKAVLMASGEKIKDDPKLLKKTIKRTEAQKRRSAKEWKLRMEKVKQDEIRRQKKREENIQRRKEEKKGGSKNKKKARPGFEGAHRGVKSKKK